jgi:ubiquitin-protein ligase
MNKQRILKDAQQIASQFPFWMVSGDISHIFGYVIETKENKYGLEIKFGKNYPQTPPKLDFHEEIENLLGNIELDSIKRWSPQSSAIDIVKELAFKLQDKLGKGKRGTKNVPSTKHGNVSPTKPKTPQNFSDNQNDSIKSNNTEHAELSLPKSEEEYITPDLNVYPPDFEYEKSGTETHTETYTEEDLFIGESQETVTPEGTQSSQELDSGSLEAPLNGTHQPNLNVMTELGLIRQEYAYDDFGTKQGQIQVYITITLTKTFIIKLDFSNYPNRPKINVPSEVRKIIGDPYQGLETLKEWNPKDSPHAVEVLRELEKKLFSIKDIEKEIQKIKREYQFQQDPHNQTKLRIHLLTYGFQEYLMDIDLDPYPNPPDIKLSSNLKELIETPINELDSVKNWSKNESEVVEIIREISWLVDKNSRINFELELLKEEYKNIQYDSNTETLIIEMEGKMKTEDLRFKFEINLPRSYPMKVPAIRILNKFELETHEKVKKDLEASFKDFFDEWTPYSYLLDLFHLVSKKIFEVSAVSCVICHKLDCPTCSLKIAGTEEETCFVECPHCERGYHKHCWNQTIKSFGKCGFCLKPPPPSMLP